MKKTAKAKPRSLKSIAGYLLLLSVFVTELLIYTWCRVQYVQVGYQITKETAKQQQLLALRDNLRIEQARLKSPQRIAKIAREQLGLITPNPDQVVELP
jgi:cell division protein FtsL